MKITFNDAAELQVQSVEEQSDGALLIKTIQVSEEELREIFSDEFKTGKMIVSEKTSTVGTYEKYQQLEAIVKYSAGIIGVILYKTEETPAEKAERLEATIKELEETNETLLGCVLEMSEIVYQ